MINLENLEWMKCCKLLDSSSRFNQPFRYPSEEIAVVEETVRQVTLAASDMHWFICVTYLMIICTAHPPLLTKTHVKRSLFHDVIESLRIRAQLPDNGNEDNNLDHMPDRYGFDNELLQLPRDSEFLPRRNDRIEMPSLKYRLPKSLARNENFESEGTLKEEIVVYINTPDDAPPTTTLKPKRQKRPRPNLSNKTNKPNKQADEGDETDETTERPVFNNMAGQSQIGNRESQTIVKPTVIVNFRGSVNHRESEIRIERRKNKNETKEVLPQNIFNIKQEIKLDKPDAWMGSTGNANKQPPKVKQDLRIPEKSKIEEDMMMCESSGLKQKNNRSSREQDILQIVVNV